LIIIIVVISIRNWPYQTDASGEILLKHHHTQAALRARLHTRVPAAAALAACLGKKLMKNNLTIKIQISKSWKQPKSKSEKKPNA